MNKLLSLFHQRIPARKLLQLHAHLITTSLISRPLLSARLILALSEASSPTTKPYAELLLSQLPHPTTTFAWNTIIRLCAKAPNPLRAIQFFARMKRNGLRSDNYTYPFVLKAFASMMPGRREGPAVHGEVIKISFDNDLFVANGLISFYSKSGEIVSARRIFDALRFKDSVSWNAIIAGYVSCGGEMGEAQELFDKMPRRDVFSCAILIDGYGRRHGDVVRARELFDTMPWRDLVCWNSMINGYASHGELRLARELFQVMPERSVVSWSILIEGYVRNGDAKEALLLFCRMLRCGSKPDKISMVGAVSACAQLGALDQGCWIHSYMKKNKMSSDVVIETALIDMYVKCGSLDFARKVFDNMRERNAFSCNVMIVGLGTNGFGREALELFHQMEKEGASMDDLTVLGALNVCTHAGLVTEGLAIFERMRSSIGIEPKVEHYASVVDLLGRAGRLHEARNVIETMPMQPTAALWGSLLAGCRTHRCVQAAELSVEQLMNLGADDCGVYTLMSNIYAEEGMWEDVWRIRKEMTERGMKKETGRSFIEVDGSAHEFVNKDFSHSSNEEIYVVIWSLFNVMASER